MIYKSTPPSTMLESDAISIKQFHSFFPITSSEKLIDLLTHIFSPAENINNNSQNTSPVEPNLAFVSIILGYVEHHLTHLPSTSGEIRRRRNSSGSSKSSKKQHLLDTFDAIESRSDQMVEQSPVHVTDTPAVAVTEISFPVLSFIEAERLYTEFFNLVAGLQLPASKCDKKDVKGLPTLTAPDDCRELVTSLSNLFWSRLSSNTFRDRGQSHGQSIYSLLTDCNLDSFGLAYSVVAACQLLGCPEIYLALSEDHAWVQFGDETAEVAWNGRSNEDKRGLPVTTGIADRSWLYLNGHPVLCKTSMMSCAAAITAINPLVTPISQNAELASVKQSLLWHLYNSGFLAHYPLALLNLAELEETSQQSNPSDCHGPVHNISPRTLFEEGVSAARLFYADQHVYPYMFTAGHFFRSGMFPETLSYWAEAARVISDYNYTKEDQEIYKEFHEVAYTQLPNLMRLAAASDNTDKPLLQSSQCLASVLRFIDGLCRWEEGSSTPVLHVGWANKLMSTLIRFDGVARAGLPALMDKEMTHTDTGMGLSTALSAECAEEELDWSSSSCASAASPQDLLGPPHEIYDLISLARACELRVLNPEYLLGCPVEPFLPPNTDPPPISSILLDKLVAPSVSAPPSTKTRSIPPPTPSNLNSGRLVLASAKMSGIQHLLSTEKLNASAIKLQLTAQSQVSVKRTDLSNPYGLPRKRTRRN